MIFPAEDPRLNAPRPTALFSASASACEANIWTSVNGWSAVRVFTDVNREYDVAKKGVAIADLGPMARYAIRGGDAGAFLARATTVPASRLETGESARGLMLDDRGRVIDLAEVSRLSGDLFLLTASQPHARRLQLALRGFDAVIEDIGRQVAALGVFGPGANDALAAAGMKTPGDSVAASAMLRGVETAARPIQFSALPGVELVFPREEALTVWERLTRRSGAEPIGLDAFEMLRLESGAPRPGVDFVPADRARGDEAMTPAELGLAHLAPLDRGWFNGRRALRDAPAAASRRLATLAIDDESAAAGTEIYDGGKPVGRVTSWAWSPAARRVAAFARLSGSLKTGDLEAARPLPASGRVRAKLVETAESALERAFLEAQGPLRGSATDFRR